MILSAGHRDKGFRISEVLAGPRGDNVQSGASAHAVCYNKLHDIPKLAFQHHSQFLRF